MKTVLQQMPEVDPTTTGNDAREHRMQELAAKVIDLARGQLIADSPFLASSMGLLDTRYVDGLEGPFATEGQTLYIDAAKVLADFSHLRRAPAADLVHTLLHCVLLHPFVSSAVDGMAWDLAADIVAEALVGEVAGTRLGERGSKIGAVLKQLTGDLGGQLTTERLYRALRDGAYADKREQWAELFHVDDHRLWPSFDTGGATGKAGRQQGEGTGGERQGDDAGDGAPERTRNRANRRDNHSQPASENPAEGSTPSLQNKQVDGSPDKTAGSDGPATQPADGSQAASKDADLSPLNETQRKRAEEAWSRAAKSMRVDLETISRKQGAGVGGLMRELEVSEHREMDYREFLRQFAVEREQVHVSDDEFDYVFYTYGLELYEDMPLIEPLEYRSEKRIRDFAIVIDTSSSVSAKVVQEFVNTTFDVLTSEGGFFAQTNIHIIQADARVQSDVKITSLADLNQWRRNIKLQGFGGTDFRPAFRYVQELRQSGEFDDLQGLVYFTDGWGIYPDRMPPYPCAFVFYDEDHRPELVPPWAIQLVLHPGEFQSLSVY